MNERVVVFGKEGSLAGVLAEPEAGRGSAERPAIILLNAGTLHRIGPHRVYVKIARRLVEAGFPVLRFDLSGLGESPPRRDHLPYHESTVRETQDAMDFLSAETGARLFVPIGFCGGADVAFRAACGDHRVAGAALIDWFAYRTLGWYLRHWGSPLASVSGWREILRARGPLGAELGNLIRRRAGGGKVMNDAGAPSKKQAVTDLRGLIERGVRLLYVYTGGQLRYYNYRRQFADAFRSLDLRGCVDVDFFADSDHTLTLLRHQQRVIDSITRWLSRVWTWAPDGVAPRLPADGLGGGAPASEAGPATVM